MNDQTQNTSTPRSIITVNVEKQHIVTGKRANAFRCPLALAISEATEIDEVGIADGYANFYDETFGFIRSVELPKQAVRWYHRFDMFSPWWLFARPFSFQLETGDLSEHVTKSDDASGVSSPNTSLSTTEEKCPGCGRSDGTHPRWCAHNPNEMEEP